MLTAILAPLLLAATTDWPPLPRWAAMCARSRGLPEPIAGSSPGGVVVIGIVDIVVHRYDPVGRVLDGMNGTTRALQFAMDSATVVDAGVDPIEPGDSAMLRLVFEPPCTVRVSGVEVNAWESEARITATIPGGFRFDRLDYHTGEVDDRLAPEDGRVVPHAALPLPSAVIAVRNRSGTLGDLVPGTRIRMYGRKSPRSNVVRYFRIEAY